MANAIITEDLRQIVGDTSEPATIDIDKTLITRFVQAIGDENPLWGGVKGDGNAACLTAPPSFYLAAVMLAKTPLVKHLDKFPPRMLDGGSELEVFQLVRNGERITVTTTITDLAERSGRMGLMLFVICESTWRNQQGEPMARAVSTTIMY